MGKHVGRNRDRHQAAEQAAKKALAAGAGEGIYTMTIEVKVEAAPEGATAAQKKNNPIRDYIVTLVGPH
jgi:hypothetical protein